MSKNLSREEKERILQKRAEVLAKRDEEDTFEYWGLEVVEFTLGDDRFAFESSFIQEVLPLKGLTPLPCTPPSILGIINHRGGIVSVMDLRLFFQLPENDASRDYLILLSSREMEVGIVAHRILGNRFIPYYQIDPPPPTLTKMGKVFLKGVVNGELIIFDGEKFLHHRSIIVNEESLS